MPDPGRRDRLLLVLALLAALLLHLPAHVSLGGAGREPLYEDGPALVSNPAIDAYGSDGLADVVRRAATDPAAAWSEGDGVVGRSRWRPVSQAAFAVEHWFFRGAPAQAAAGVSLALHLAVVALTFLLLRRLGAPRAALWIAPLAVAANPAALAAAAWPARQAIVLATAAGLGAAVLAVRGGFLRSAAAAVLVILSAGSHELGFGLALGTIVLAASVPGDDGRRRAPWAVGLAAVAAALWRARALADVPVLPAGGAAPGPLDGVVGIVHAAVSLVLPARLHFADGPWTAGLAGRVVALAAVAGAVAWFARRPAGASTLGLAAIATLLPLAGLGFAGGASGAPFTDGALYAAAAFGAPAVAWALGAAAERGRALRLAALAAAAAWLVAAGVGTAERAPQFRTRASHVRLAVNEMPDSPVVEAWSLASDVGAAAGAGTDALPQLRQLTLRAEALARRVTAPDALAVSRDPVAAVTIAASLSRVSAALMRAGLPPGDDAWESAAAAVDGATKLAPGWAQAWIVLSATHDRAGALRAAWAASARAGEISPRNLDVLATGVRSSLRLGDARLAAGISETLLEEEERAARAEGRRPRPETILLFARAQSADGAVRVPDPFAEKGVRFRFEVAVAALRGLVERGELVEEARRELDRTLLRYGDLLASLDRTALALLAYRQAAETGVGDPQVAEHEAWLRERLAAEQAAAQSALDRAVRGEGNVVDALVGLATAFSRQGRWQEAAEVFDRLERDVGMPPALRYHRAIQVHRETDPRKATEELRAVVAAEPGFARAHFDLANLLEEAGEYDAALASYREARRLAVDQASTEGAEEWLLDADARFEALERLLAAIREDR